MNFDAPLKNNNCCRATHDRASEREKERGVLEQGERSETARQEERARERETETGGAGMSLNQLRTGKVVREAVVKLAKSYEGPLKVCTGRTDRRHAWCAIVAS